MMWKTHQSCVDWYIYTKWKSFPRKSNAITVTRSFHFV